MKVDLTYEQLLFYKAKQKLEEIQRIEEDRPLTYEEQQERSQIKELLWKSILKFAIQESHRIMQKYNLPSDAYYDVQQELALIFFEKLDAYNPLITTPTTYYVRYFRQAITEYLRGYSQNLSQYDANNLKLVRRAINYYESQGINWTEEMIVAKTNLSAKIVKTTLFFGMNSKHASVEDAMELKSTLPTPEEAYHEKEVSETLLNALIRNIDKEELDLLLLRVNASGPKEMPYEKIAKKLNIPVKEVKSRLNGIICKLNQDEELAAEFKDYKPKAKIKTIKLQDDSAPILENQLTDYLNELHRL